MPKRIFIGIAISDNLQKEILEWQKSRPDLKVRWLKPKNLHITLVPPWFEKNVDRIKEKISLLKKFKPFIIKFNKISLGPNIKHPWATVHRVSPKLIWLEGRSKEFNNLKIELEKYFENKDIHPPKLHVTIARFKISDFLKFPKKELSEKIDWEEEVENITLFESLGNSEYKALYDIIL